MKGRTAESERKRQDVIGSELNNSTLNELSLLVLVVVVLCINLLCLLIQFIRLICFKKRDRKSVV